MFGLSCATADAASTSRAGAKIRQIIFLAMICSEEMFVVVVGRP
jgi:hypothetical protein